MMNFRGGVNIEKLFRQLFKKTYFLIISYFLSLFLTLPSPFFTQLTGLDPSWVVGLVWAHPLSLQFGSDILFTYGPLGYLNYPTYIDYSLWVSSLFFLVSLQILYLGLIFLYLHSKQISNLLSVLTILVLFFSNGYIAPEYKLIISATLLLYFSFFQPIIPKFQLYLLGLGCGALMATATLIKFNGFLITCSIFAVYFLFSLWERKNRVLFVILTFSYTGFFLALWLISGQNIHDIVSFIINSLDISTNYNIAMSTEAVWILKGIDFFLILKISAIVSFILVFWIIIKSYIIDKRDTLFIALIWSGLLLFAYKHSFVRLDAHVFIYCSIFSVFFILISPFIIKNFSSKNKINLLFSFIFVLNYFFLVFILILSAIIFSGGIPCIGENTINNNMQYSKTINYLAQPNLFIEERDLYRNQIQGKTKLHDIFSRIQTNTVDVIPWEISLLYIYNASWSPRPIFQSYSSYSSKLDRLNNDHYSGEDAPEFILWSTQSIDNRYPFFEEPLTYKTVFTNYHPVLSQEEWLLLEKNSKPKKLIMNQSTEVYEKLNQNTQLLPDHATPTFAHVYIKKTFIGTITELLYKIPPLEIQFTFKNQTKSKKYRFNYGPSENGILISKFVGNNEDLNYLLSDYSNCTDIIAYTIYSKDPLFYDEKFKVIYTTYSLDP